MRDSSAPNANANEIAPLSALAQDASWVVLYGATVLLGRLTAVPETGLALFWPAAGVSALWLYRLGGRVLTVSTALLFGTATALNLLTGVALLAALVFGVANVVVGFAARQVLAAPPRLRARTGTPEVAMESSADVVTLAQASAVAGVASAPFGVLAGYLIAGHTSAFIALAWVLRNTTGVFIVAGLVLALAAANRARRSAEVPRSGRDLLTHEPRAHAVLELTATVAVTVVTLLLVFEDDQGLSLAFLLVAVSALTGLRFTPVVATVLATGISLFAVVATLAGRGPFGVITDPVLRAVVVQTFVLVQAAISVTLSWAIHERNETTRDLVLARAEADRRAQLLDAVTDRLDHGIAVIDSDGTVLVRNAAAARLVPGPAHRVTCDDQPSRYGVHRDDGAPMDLSTMPHSVVLDTGTSVSAGFVVRRSPPEADTHVSVQADPLELGGSPTTRVAVVSMRDDTAYRQHVDELETFTGTVAHDLRNPLAAMRIWTEVLVDHLEELGALDAQVTGALGRITRSEERMNRLIDDLLAYATAFNAPLDVVEIALDELVRDIAEEVTAADTRGSLVLAHGLGTMSGDPALVRQVLTNLIGNALKYTAPDVRPVVRIDTARADHPEPRVVVRVTDNGVGIPPEMRTAVFDRFTRVPATARTRTGSGLGLAISARAVRRHGGTIAVDAGPGGLGSTFTLTFPDEPHDDPGRATSG